MIAILELLVILGIGYIGTHYFAERIRARFHVTTGIEFVVLGVLAGPHVTDVVTPEVLVQLGPVISLAIGAVGLILGLELRFARPEAARRQALAMSFFGVTTTFVIVAGLAAVILWYTLPPGQFLVALPAAVALGAIASVSTPEPARTVDASMSQRTQLATLLEATANFDRWIAVALFGLVFCVFHIGETVGVRPLTATEWVAVSIGIGGVLGGLFHLFLGREQNPDKLLLALMGIILFSSGAAYYLNLSPLFVNLVLGTVLANTFRHTDALQEVMGSIERPLKVVILVLAGAAWNLPALANPIVIGLVIVCLLGRPVGKLLGGALTFRYAESRAFLTPWMGMGTLAHGGLAVAMAVNFNEVYAGVATDGLFSAVLISVLVWEVLAPSRIRRALIDAEPALAPRAVSPA